MLIGFVQKLGHGLAVSPLFLNKVAKGRCWLLMSSMMKDLEKQCEQPGVLRRVESLRV